MGNKCDKSKGDKSKGDKSKSDKKGEDWNRMRVEMVFLD